MFKRMNKYITPEIESSDDEEEQNSEINTKSSKVNTI